MAKSSLEIVKSFQKKLISLEHTRKKQEGLFSEKLIAKRDIEEVYAAIFLNAITSFEALIEELFIGMLSRKIRSSNSSVKVRVNTKSPVIARELLLHGKKYIDWLPYEHTEKVAKIFFTGGRPFTFVTNDKSKHIEKCLAIRHALAHHSRHSVENFKKKVLGELPVMPIERNPKAFLRSQFSASPPTTYYQQLVGELLNIMKILC